MNHKQLLQEFTDWLVLLGYSKNTIAKVPKIVVAFLDTTQVKKIKSITDKHFYDYYAYLQTRANQTRGGGLSNKTLNQYQWALKKFSSYLNHFYELGLAIYFSGEKLPVRAPEFLTIEQIKQLFATCDRISHPYRQRFKAMLVLLYSCGLRRTEASKLEVQDIRFDIRVIHVKEGKNSKQRFVPFNHYSAEILKEYLLDARIHFSKYDYTTFLLGRGGKPLLGEAIASNLQKLLKETNSRELQEKKITPHTLRHSIATHLLQQGMPIEKIQAFLGHSSLESTQIYTHITEDEI